MPTAGKAACTLRRALSYQNRDVVARFAKHFRVADDESAAIFEECKKWLWLHAVPGAPPLEMMDEFVVIDEMWHTFVLYTRDYSRYCVSRFGAYMHHNPTSLRALERHRRDVAKDRDAVLRKWRRQRERQYRHIADHLGVETLQLWYVDYPLRYGREFFARVGIDVDGLDGQVERELVGLSRQTDGAGGTSHRA